MSFASALAAVQQKQQQQQNVPSTIPSQPSGPGPSSLSIRGAGNNGPSTRGVGAALRAAGLGTKGSSDGMDVDGARPRRGAGASSSSRRDGRPSGPMGDRPAHARNDPYSRPPKNTRSINPNPNNNAQSSKKGPRRNDGRPTNSGSQAGTELLSRIGNGQSTTTDSGRKPHRDSKSKPPPRKHNTPNKPYCFPIDVNEWSFENDDQRALVQTFCQRFFESWDNNRASLYDVYHPLATFSNSFSTANTRSKQWFDVRRTAQSIVQNNNTAPPLAHWISPRNLFKHKNSIDRYKKLKNSVDREGLLQHWRALPSTKHPMSQANKWALDSHSVGNRIILSIQGEFEEQPSGTNRAFSRTIILAPAPAGSAAAIANWPAIIMSDSLVVSLHVGTAAFDEHRSLAKHGVTINPTTTNGVPPTDAAVNPAQATSILPDQPQSQPAAVIPPGQPQSQDISQSQKEECINQLRGVTGMNIQYATMCLEGNAWNLEQAWNNFQELKATIPPEAYVQ